MTRGETTLPYNYQTHLSLGPASTFLAAHLYVSAQELGEVSGRDVNETTSHRHCCYNRD